MKFLIILLLSLKILIYCLTMIFIIPFVTEKISVDLDYTKPSLYEELIDNKNLKNENGK